LHTPSNFEGSCLLKSGLGFIKGLVMTNFAR
jgi:hypothetical protein